MHSMQLLLNLGCPYLGRNGAQHAAFAQHALPLLRAQQCTARAPLYSVLAAEADYRQSAALDACSHSQMLCPPVRVFQAGTNDERHRLQDQPH